MVTSFPFGNEIVNSAFTFYRASTKSLIDLVPLLFLIRLIILQATLGKSHSYMDLIKDLLFMYVGFFIFQEVVETIMLAPKMAEELIHIERPPIIIPSKDEPKWYSYWFGFEFMNDIDLLKYLSIFFYWICSGVYLVLMSTMIMAGAFIILFSTLVKQRWMGHLYISILLILSLWPFLWYGIDQSFLIISKNLVSSGSQLSLVLASITGGVIKLAIPTLGLYGVYKGVVKPFSQKANEAKESFQRRKDQVTGGVKKASDALGVGTAIESFREDPQIREKKREERENNKKFRLNDTAPLMAYGVQKALNKHPKLAKTTADYLGYKPVEGDHNISGGGYNAFKQHTESKKIKRNQISRSNSSPSTSASGGSSRGGSSSGSSSAASSGKKDSKALSQEHQSAFNKASGLNGVKVEKLGNWVWAKDVDGKNKANLEAMGFEYSKEKDRYYVGPKKHDYEAPKHTYKELQNFYKKGDKK